MSHIEKTLILSLVGGLQGVILTGLFAAPYICTSKVPRYSAADLAQLNDRYRDIGRKAAANVLWVIVALSMCGLAVLAGSDAGARGGGAWELIALVIGIMLIGFIRASFALTTGTIPAFTLRRFGWEYIYGAGPEVRTGALWQIGFTLLVPLSILIRWYVEVVS